jgi:transposase
MNWRKDNRGRAPLRFDAQAYKGSSVVERAINRLKDFRAVSTCYENAATTSLQP